MEHAHHARAALLIRDTYRTYTWGILECRHRYIYSTRAMCNINFDSERARARARAKILVLSLYVTKYLNKPRPPAFDSVQVSS